MAKGITTKPTRLATRVETSDTTIKVYAFEKLNGDKAYSMSDLGLSNGETAYLTIEPDNADNIEFISFTGITNNNDGTVTLTGVQRGIKPEPPYNPDVSYAKIHLANSKAIFSDSPPYEDKLVTKHENQVVEGRLTFKQNPRKTGDLQPTYDDEYATKKYVDDVVTGGNLVNASLVLQAIAGETINRGKVIYINPNDSKLYLSDINNAQSYNNVILGVADNGGNVGDNIRFVVLGAYTSTGTFTQGTDYYLSTNGDLTDSPNAGQEFYIGTALDNDTLSVGSKDKVNSITKNQLDALDKNPAINIINKVISNYDTSNGASYEANTISISSADNSINDSNADFVNAGFYAGAELKITGSNSNDGSYLIKSVQANKIVVDANLTDETAGATIKLEIPKANKIVKFTSSGELPGGGNVEVVECLAFNDIQAGDIVYLMSTDPKYPLGATNSQGSTTTSGVGFTMATAYNQQAGNYSYNMYARKFYLKSLSGINSRFKYRITNFMMAYPSHVTESTSYNTYYYSTSIYKKSGSNSIVNKGSGGELFYGNFQDVLQLANYFQLGFITNMSVDFDINEDGFWGVIHKNPSLSYLTFRYWNMPYDYAYYSNDGGNNWYLYSSSTNYSFYASYYYNIIDSQNSNLPIVVSSNYVNSNFWQLMKLGIRLYGIAETSANSGEVVKIRIRGISNKFSITPDKIGQYVLHDGSTSIGKYGKEYIGRCIGENLVEISPGARKMPFGGSYVNQANYFYRWFVWLNFPLYKAYWSAYAWTGSNSYYQSQFIDGTFELDYIKVRDAGNYNNNSGTFTVSSNQTKGIYFSNSSSNSYPPQLGLVFYKDY